MLDSWLQCGLAWLPGSVVCVYMYSLYLVGGCGIYRSVSGGLTDYNLYRLSCAFYKWDRVELAVYSLYMSWLAIYSIGGVGDM